MEGTQSISNKPSSSTMTTTLNAKPSQASFSFLDTMPPSPGLPRSMGTLPPFSPSSVTLAHSIATKPSQATLKGDVIPLRETEEKHPELEKPQNTDNLEKLPLPVTSHDVGPPPDGGLQAWLTVLGCSLVSFSTFGCVLLSPLGIQFTHFSCSIVNAFGAFSDFYRSNYLSSSSPTLVSMIGSVGVFVLYSCESIFSRVYNYIVLKKHLSKSLPLPGPSSMPLDPGI